MHWGGMAAARTAPQCPPPQRRPVPPAPPAPPAAPGASQTGVWARVGCRSVGRGWGVTGHAVGALASPCACHFAPSWAPCTHFAWRPRLEESEGIKPAAAPAASSSCFSIDARRSPQRRRDNAPPHLPLSPLPSPPSPPSTISRVATRGPWSPDPSRPLSHTPNPTRQTGQGSRAPSSHRSMRMHHSTPADARQGPAARCFERHRGGLGRLAASAA